MDSTTIRNLYAYNTWANQRLFATAMALSPEQFVAPVTADHGSIRDLMVHLVDVQRVWLARVRREQPTGGMSADVNTVEALFAIWQKVDQETHDFLDSLTADELAEVIHYINLAGQPNAYPCWQILFHQANHATQHRSEVAWLMTQLGHSTGNLDYLLFLDATGQNLAG